MALPSLKSVSTLYMSSAPLMKIAKFDRLVNLNLTKPDRSVSFSASMI